MDYTDHQIREFIYRECPELAGARLSIGKLGNQFQVIATDQFHVMHTLKFTLADMVQ